MYYDLAGPFRRDGGHAFIADLPAEIVETLQGGQYVAVLQEDGRTLGPADAQHDAIRKMGRGAYSVWNGSLWFSSAANEDCNKNRRSYRILLIDVSAGSATSDAVLRRASRDDKAVLQFLADSGNRNNSFLSNFFGYRHTIGSWIERANMTVPRRMVELGCGNIPWTALRFLLDGTENYIANDIMCVRRAFPKAEIELLKSTCALIEPKLLAKWSKVFPYEDRDSIPTGLDVRDGVGFEALTFTDEVDCTISTSVLEHVMDPTGIYRKLSEVTPSGGFMFHSIDLRDHRFFETDPLAFLRETEGQYASVKTENRLRSSHHIALADQFGFDVVASRYYLLRSTGSPIWTDHPNEFVLGVTEAIREQMDVEFRSLELLDLSTAAIQLLFRKR
ncbi:hypothetical protein [Rhizobium sp. 57MFTsu3.2]|uniref:hypothetical protein n=1 Tax=Rhizobium sp. 57MFTsu3.2 TaxID=1048681 RepID=UPI00146D5FAB|nr:hypothetical protein [Rhizobium sp. 57MFTsu3.2]NMN73819.1 hypothetical protein [Rhizobium sp. 57MFTsu3.2]